MTGKERPNFLFIGLANKFSDSYYDTMKDIYKELGCECSYLKKKNLINNYDIVKNKIDNADIIYIGGGDSIKLMNEVSQYKLDELLKGLSDNVVVAGMSAGAIMIAGKGYSDSLILRDESENFSFVSGLGLVDINVCPHYNLEVRKEGMKKDLVNSEQFVFGLENGVALKIDGEKREVIKSLDDVNCYLCYYDNNKYVEEVYYGLDKM